MMDLSNKVAVVTGSKRIGSVVAIELARRGADVAICYNRSKTEADKTAEAVKALGRRVFIKQANLTQAHDCETFINESVAALGRLDVLVNMASIYVSIPFDQLTVAQYDENVNVDMRAAFICSRAAVPHLRKSRRRAHHQFFRLAFQERPPALHRLSSLLRGEDRRDWAHRGPGAGAGAGQDPRERDCARTNPGAAGHH